MIVIVDEALFAAAQTSQLDLIDLIKSCLDGHHALITDPPGISEHIEGWLRRHPPDLQDELRLVIEEGPNAASQRTAAAPRIRVSGAATSELHGPIPTLTLRDALRLLKAPLSLLLENDRNDGAVNHQLQRRSIENYIPVQALFAWSEKASGAERTRLRRCTEAYARRLPRDRQEHYNLKGGLVDDVRDARRRRWYRDSGTNIVDEADLHPHFQALRLPEDVRRCLHGGFGADVATLFHDDAEHGIRIEEEWLNREIPHEHRMSIVQSIFDRM